MPICTKCKIKKPEDQFYLKIKKIGSLRATCKECHAKWKHEWYLRNQDKIKIYRERFKNKEYISECINCKKQFKRINQLETCSVQCYIEGYSKKTHGGCWEWQKGISPSGYGVSTYQGKQYRTHRLSYQVFKGELEKGKVVCHKCDNPICCNPEHLFLGTCKENSQDCSKKGRNTKGTWIPRKHNQETARNCFEMWKSGMSILDISKELEMQFTTVYWATRRYAKSIGFDFSKHEVKTNKERPKFLKIPAEKCHKILSLRQDGKTFLQISQETGVKLSTCKYICAHPDRLKDEHEHSL